MLDVKIGRASDQVKAVDWHDELKLLSDDDDDNDDSE